MPTSLATTIAAAVKEGLSLWKVFIATRQEAYNRKKDKKQEKAIEIAEMTFEEVSKLFEFLHELPMEEKAMKELSHRKKLIYRLKAKFNKYD